MMVCRPAAAAWLRKWVLEASEQDMGLILNALSVQVKASQDQVLIEGAVPLAMPEGEDLVTIVQTSGCLFNSHQKMPAVPFKVTAHL